MATKINDISSSLMTNAISSLKEAKTQKTEAAFQSFLNTAVSGNTSNAKTEAGQNNVAGSQKSEYTSDENTCDMKNVSDDKTVEVNELDGQKTAVQDEGTEKTEIDKANEVIDEVCQELGITREEFFDSFENLLDSIAAILMEKFGVSEQEVNSVLESLGLSLTDMFNQADLMKVVAALTGSEDISAVLTDENLYGQVQEIVEELTSLKNDFTADTMMNTEQLQVLEASVETVMKPEAMEADVDESLLTKDVMPNSNVDEVAMNENESVLEIVFEKQDSSKLNQQGQHMTGNEGFQQFAGKVADYTQQVMAASGNEFVQQADMEAIIRQVTDYVKMQVTAETTSLEMQLHPDSYGKLNLQVSVRDGVVTAKLAVENEMVKSALEAQVVQLREDMNERGLKVDAVEVAIASHEFERNLEEGQENHERSQEESNGVHRQINLREEEMSIEELAAMSEAEALTRKIMLENGNSIDFSA